MKGQTPCVRSAGEFGKSVFGLFGFMAIAGTIASCAPYIRDPYYRPSYPDNSAVLEQPHMEGPFDLLALSIPDGGTLRVSLEGYHPNSLSLSLDLYSPGNSTLQFTSDAIRLRSLEDGTEWTMKAHMSVNYGFDTSMHSSHKMNVDPIPYDEAVEIREPWRNYISPESKLAIAIPFSIKNFSPDVVHVHLPPITTGSNEYIIPPVLATAEEKKWDWWAYDEKDVDIDAFHIALYAKAEPSGYSTVPGFTGEIHVIFAPDKKWKFATNEIKFEDVRSGEERRTRFTYLSWSCAPTIPFTAPLGGPVSTSSYITLETGKHEPSQLVLEIPSVLINGREFVIKPIGFDLIKSDMAIGSL